MAGMRFAVERRREELIGRRGAIGHATCGCSGPWPGGATTPTSDVDFLVDFEPVATLLDLADLKDEFEEILGRSVDVLSSRVLKPRDEDIRREAIAL